jgi:putative ABC transport system permease protein
LGRVRSGWLVETTRPLTSAQLTAAREAAAPAGLAVEGRDEQGGLATTRTVATLAGILLALAILAMTVGLIRSESGRDLRTLTATGATSHTRRLLTAVTAGALALLGVLLGAAARNAPPDTRPHPLPTPVGYLAAMAIGVPARRLRVGSGRPQPPLLRAPARLTTGNIAMCGPTRHHPRLPAGGKPPVRRTTAVCARPGRPPPATAGGDAALR